MLRLILKKWILTSALAGLTSTPAVFGALYYQRPKGPDGWQRGERRWPGPDWPDVTAKRLEEVKNISQPGPEIEFLYARASELLDRARQARGNYFRSGRLLGATNALLDAGDRILWSRKIERGPQEQDYWGADFYLQGCYFRIRQADFFASLSGEKDADQYVTLSRSLYQQARGAYDAREFQRARLLGDASSFIVFALESIAQAAIPVPERPVPK
jgi:hypothetical protein